MGSDQQIRNLCGQISRGYAKTVNHFSKISSRVAASFAPAPPPRAISTHSPSIREKRKPDLPDRLIVPSPRPRPGVLPPLHARCATLCRRARRSPGRVIMPLRRILHKKTAAVRPSPHPVVPALSLRSTPPSSPAASPTAVHAATSTPAKAPQPESSPSAVGCSAGSEPDTASAATRSDELPAAATGESSAQSRIGTESPAGPSARRCVSPPDPPLYPPCARRLLLQSDLPKPHSSYLCHALWPRALSRSPGRAPLTLRAAYPSAHPASDFRCSD